MGWGCAAAREGGLVAIKECAAAREGGAWTGPADLDQGRLGSGPTRIRVGLPDRHRTASAAGDTGRGPPAGPQIRLGRAGRASWPDSDMPDKAASADARGRAFGNGARAAGSGGSRPGPRLAPSPAGPSLTVRAQAVSLGPAYVPVPSPSLRVWQRQCMAQRRMRQRRRRSAPGRLPSQVRLAEITAKCTPSQASRPVPVTVRSGSAQSRCKLREAGLGPCVRSDCPARARARQRPASLSCGRITLFLVSGDG